METQQEKDMFVTPVKEKNDAARNVPGAPERKDQTEGARSLETISGVQETLKKPILFSMLSANDKEANADLGDNEYDSVDDEDTFDNHDTIPVTPPRLVRQHNRPFRRRSVSSHNLPIYNPDMSEHQSHFASSSSLSCMNDDKEEEFDETDIRRDLSRDPLLIDDPLEHEREPAETDEEENDDSVTQDSGDGMHERGIFDYSSPLRACKFNLSDGPDPARFQEIMNDLLCSRLKVADIFRDIFLICLLVYELPSGIAVFLVVFSRCFFMLNNKYDKEKEPAFVPAI